MAQVQEIHLQTQAHPIRAREDSSASTASAKDHHVIDLPQNNCPPLQDSKSKAPSHSQPKQSISILPCSIIKRWRWWVVVLVNIVSVLAGQTVATLLGRFYFNEGGDSMWMATIIQSAGAPFLILPLLFIPNKSSVARPPLHKIVSVYIVLGVLIAADNLMYSYGLLYLPVSTYSLICATQLGFNAIFSYFINKQKFTALIFNSVILLTFSAALLGVNSDSSDSNIPKDKYPLGFVLTLGASAMFSLIVSLMQLTFETVIKAQTFSWVLELQIYSNTVASTITVVGLFISGEWRNITAEYNGYQTGKASYALTLVGTAVGWQVFSVGLIGLLSTVSSLFANVISTLVLPLVPVFAVIFFHDGMNGIKVMAMLIALWGFLSYIYQHYLDDAKAKRKIQDVGLNDVNQS